MSIYLRLQHVSQHIFCLGCLLCASAPRNKYVGRTNKCRARGGIWHASVSVLIKITHKLRKTSAIPEYCFLFEHSLSIRYEVNVLCFALKSGVFELFTTLRKSKLRRDKLELQLLYTCNLRIFSFIRLSRSMDLQLVECK